VHRQLLQQVLVIVQRLLSAAADWRYASFMQQLLQQ
jgi:hypothetical protein